MYEIRELKCRTRLTALSPKNTKEVVKLVQELSKVLLLKLSGQCVYCRFFVKTKK